MNTKFRVLIVGKPKFDISTLVNDVTNEFDYLIIKRVNGVSDIMNSCEKTWDVIIYDHHSLVSDESDAIRVIEEKILAIPS